MDRNADVDLWYFGSDRASADSVCQPSLPEGPVHPADDEPDEDDSPAQLSFR